MQVLTTFTEDLEIAKAILARNARVTKEFLYVKCYPLFKSIFDNYCTDSSDVYEFISEIYLLILTPSKKTGRCQLENFRGESTLASWMKTACLFYCYHKYKNKKRIPTVEITTNDDDDDDRGDRLLDKAYSTPIELSSLDRADAETIINMMPNERYRHIIKLRYLERMTNEETAEALGMSMANYYNKHKLAKAQFIAALEKETKQ